MVNVEGTGKGLDKKTSSRFIGFIFMIQLKTVINKARIEKENFPHFSWKIFSFLLGKHFFTFHHFFFPSSLIIVILLVFLLLFFPVITVFQNQLCLVIATICCSFEEAKDYLLNDIDNKKGNPETYHLITLNGSNSSW